ncbi:SIMPL domain-containing protein [Paraurantiacibacter namhicola]|uniref:26 kDa periplasmic immunogenic protein n=1 Tax=Paraurantiacibacter namhicola TaxID=645517 RepID=A0A1C7DA26_9SPHN|nr:SIMPL domain-containing protein [Paraurantiacibacter namhicola]ANU08285.1 26 kDa periplasmic immunogenic protein precursor [Paraurantiacibacter namhicola]
MSRFAIPAALAIACALPATAHAAEVQVQAAGPVIELTVTEQVKAKPDIATIRTGVTTQARTAVEAMRLNALEMTKVIERLKALGVDPDDIQTTGVRLGAEYDYNNQTRRQVFRGYSASNGVMVTVRDVANVGPLLDALVAQGATDIGGPDFSIEDDSAAREQAREAAVMNGRAQALQYARWNGYSDVRLIAVEEVIRPGMPQPVARMASLDVMEESASTPIQPGMVATGVTVTLKYEMVR